MEIILFILLAFLSLFILLIGTALFLLMRDSLFLRVPFVPVRKRAVGKIIEVLNMDDGDILYDLGCGDGRILIEATRQVPGLSCIGVEKGVLPFSISFVRTFLLPIKIRYKDIMSTDISSATHIYCYLSTNLLGELSPKFLSECKTGTRIVTCDFEIPNWQPVRKVPLDANEDNLSKTLYLYRI